MTEIPDPALPKEQEREWSIYDGAYDSSVNPPSDEALDLIAAKASEPFLSEDARYRVLLGNVAIYALSLCDPRLSANKELHDRIQRQIGQGLMRITGSFSEVDSKTRAEAEQLELPDPPAFAAIDEVERRRFINSHGQRAIKNSLRMIMIAEKRDYDMRVIESIFEIILSEKPAESADDHVE